MSAASTQLVEALSPSARASMAAKGYLARNRGKTLQTYEISLRIFFRFMLAYRIDPLDATRPHIELFMRVHLEEERGCRPSSVHHHMGVIRGFYKFAVIDDYIVKDPTLGVLLPKIFVDEWRLDWVTNQELHAILDTAAASSTPSEHALIALLGVLGLRIDECLRVQVGDFSETIGGYRVLRLIGKGGKPATIPLPVSVVRILDRAAGNRTEGALLLRDAENHRVDYRGLPMTYPVARRTIDRIVAAAGIERQLTPHMFRRGVITKGIGDGLTMSRMQHLARHSDPRTTARYDRSVQNLDGHAVHELARRLLGGGE